MTMTLLIVDDDDMLRTALKRKFSGQFHTLSASCVPEALRLLALEQVDIVLTDFQMPDINGMELVRYVRENLKKTEIIMMTGYSSVESAVETMKFG
ncbi:MAG: response regulator, partial [Candidatus Wallbacteria bacterium]|nr:response regulator [Candidatus Wallbacteria bacterium]